MRILELGNYVVPAYAGMILAEQGHDVTKWTNGKDPILPLNRGDELWAWINHGKQLTDDHPRRLLTDPPLWFDIIVDNFRPATLDKWGVDPAAIAKRLGCVWVSMRPDVGERSFDLVAQARSTMEFAPWAPYWLGDTAGGLWLAFKALAMIAADRRGEHFVLHQATALHKLVEGELVIDVQRDGRTIPWENEPYRIERLPDGTCEAFVQYKGQTIREPVRDRAWKLKHLHHDGGRMRI